MTVPLLNFGLEAFLRLWWWWWWLGIEIGRETKKIQKSQNCKPLVDSRAVCNRSISNNLIASRGHIIWLIGAVCSPSHFPQPSINHITKSMAPSANCTTTFFVSVLTSLCLSFVQCSSTRFRLAVVAKGLQQGLCDFTNPDTQTAPIIHA